jgi:hypothetical protein
MECAIPVPPGKWPIKSEKHEVLTSKRSFSCFFSNFRWRSVRPYQTLLRMAYELRQHLVYHLATVHGGRRVTSSRDLIPIPG